MEFKIGDKVRVINMNNAPKAYGDMTNKIGIIKWNAPSEWDNKKYGIAFEDVKNYSSEKGYFYFFKDNLELVYNNVPALPEIKEKKLTCVIHTPSKEDAICVVGKIPSALHSTTSNEWLRCWDTYKENTCYNIIDGRIDSYGSKTYFEESIERGSNYLIYEFSDLVATGGYCNGFRGGKTLIDLPKFVFDAKQAKELAERLDKELAGLFNAFPNEGISAKNGGKNSMKFTFYFNVNEGTRVDKSCNGTIPTMTTNIELLGGNVSDRVISIEGSATCDKADYDMRQGVLEALANAVFDGNFEKAYNKAAKANALCERQDRTCYYCGKVFDTVEEKQAHEAWHVERRKARHERYLLRKRAKEIAFEEAAQKLAKEIIAEDNKK